MGIRAVIFDVGGVLLQTIRQDRHRDWEVRFGLPQGGLVKAIRGMPIARLATIGKVTEQDLWRQAASTFGITEDEQRQLEHDFWAADQLNISMVEWLNEIRLMYKTAILSNAWSGARQAYSRTYGLDKLVDVMVISSEVGVAKPTRRIYEIVTDRLSVLPQEIVFIDDMEEHVSAAKSFGIRGVRFESAEQTIGQVQLFLTELGASRLGSSAG